MRDTRLELRTSHWREIKHCKDIDHTSISKEHTSSGNCLIMESLFLSRHMYKVTMSAYRSSTSSENVKAITS